MDSKISTSHTLALDPFAPMARRWPGWQAARGTYVVHSNCTGTATVITPNRPVPLHLSFVVVKEGE